ncbi:hypothetical protein [Streptomyces sp. NBC_01614]|uniref:hypothetical protein n=1 Tax=Streptomyces sp. NBC_01614 TaxID=2975897 RepID=UPI003869526B
MTHGTSTPQAQHSLRTDAVQQAANDANAHMAAPDSVTLHTMQASVQRALDLGAALADIRAARGQR